MGKTLTEAKERDAGLVAALVVFAKYGVDPDIQELLVYGNADVRPGALRAALAAERQRAETAALNAHPLDDWHEDIGTAMWWKFPIEEPPYVGSPLDLGRSYAVEMNIGDQTVTGVVTLGGWPGYHTHWTPLPPAPSEPLSEET